MVSLTLPFAALITFLMMRVFGLSANLMSLGGLAIAVGMLVDAAVVVVENTVEHLALGNNGQRAGDGPSRRQRVAEAVHEVAVPVASGIVIICLVFLPLLSLQGLEGKLFAPVALTIIFALSGSLLLSLTLIPVIASFLLKPGAAQEAWLMRKLSPLYSRLLAGVLERPRRLFIGVGAGLLAAMLAYMMAGKTFMPVMDEGSVVIQVAKLPSITLDRSLALDTAIQKAVLAAVPDVSEAISRTGSDEIGLDPMGLNETDMFLTLKPRGQWVQKDKDGIIAALLASEILAVTGRSPSEHYADLTAEHGAPAYARIDAAATREQKKALAALIESASIIDAAPEPKAG